MYRYLDMNIFGESRFMLWRKNGFKESLSMDKREEMEKKDSGL